MKGIGQFGAGNKISKRVEKFQYHFSTESKYFWSPGKISGVLDINEFHSVTTIMSTPSSMSPEGITAWIWGSSKVQQKRMSRGRELVTSAIKGLPERSCLLPWSCHRMSLNKHGAFPRHLQDLFRRAVNFPNIIHKHKETRKRHVPISKHIPTQLKTHSKERDF